MTKAESIVSSNEYTKYIEGLQEELAEKNRQLKLDENQIANASVAYKAQLSKVQVINKIWDQVYKTNDLLNKTVASIDRTKELSDILDTKAGFINQALRRVIVNVENMAYQIKIDLEDKVDALKKSIEGMNKRPDPASNIMVSIDNFNKAVEAALTAACDAIEAVLPAYQTSEMLMFHLREKGTASAKGLPALLTDLKATLSKNNSYPYHNPSDESDKEKGFYKTIL